MNNITRKTIRLVSEGDMAITQMINMVVLTNTISIFGVVANIINMVVFYKQGFSTTTNISFFGLAISDLFSLVTLLWYSTFVNPLFMGAGLPIESLEVLHVVACFPHIFFSRITSWITVYITAERCLCILVPLKIKQIITPRTTTVTLCVIVLIIGVTFVPEYATSYIGWKFYPKKNRTLLGLLYTKNRGIAEALTYIMYSIQGSLSFVAVVVFTALLIFQLKQKSKWRMTANEDKSAAESISTRERKTVTMLVMIATVLIVCYTPGVAVAMVTFFEPEFSIIGNLVNIFFVMWSIVFVFEAVNSSVNIFLYYKMSTKYRETFNEMFGIKSTK